MVLSTEWGYLAPWCLALGPYLSMNECSSDANSFGGFVLQVSDFLGAATTHPQADTSARLVFMREALELISLALSTSCASNQNALIKLFHNELLSRQFLRYSGGVFEPRFQLAFRAGVHGDCHDALDILRDAVANEWRSYPTVKYKAARIAILQRRGVDADAARVRRVRISVHLQPPLKRTSNFGLALVTAPSRADTIHYYDSLYRGLKMVSPVDATDGPTVDALELDLANLETPADVIPVLGRILALGIPIRRLALQLNYSWDAFDQATFVGVLNSSATALIDHVVIAATTCDNLEAAFDSLPLLAKCHHVELVNRVTFGYAAPSFAAAFRRTLLSSTQWRPKKLTLRGASFHLRVGTAISTGAPNGLDALILHLSGQDTASILQDLPLFGSHLTSLEIHVAPGSMSSFQLASIAKSCPRLRAVEIHGATIADLGEVPSLMERNSIAWASLVLENVVVADANGLRRMAQALTDSSSRTARTLTKFALGQYEKLCIDDILDFECALRRNKRLEYLALRPVERCAMATAAMFDGELLSDRKYAFLSALNPLVGNQTSCGSTIDTWNLVHIMEFAELVRRRKVILS